MITNSRRITSLAIATLACAYFPANRISCDREEVPQEADNIRRLNRPVPANLGLLVETHVEKILNAGYAKEISDIDLFHGHIFWKTDSSRRAFRQLAEGDISQVPLILYHTAEYNGRWQIIEKDLTSSQKTPRTIIGYPNGSIAPIRDVFSDNILSQQKNYKSHGTVHSTELKALKNGIFLGPQCYIYTVPHSRFKAHRYEFDVFFRRDERFYLQNSGLKK